MKKVGMTGPELNSKSPQLRAAGTSTTSTSTGGNTRPAPTSKKNKNTPNDSDPASTSASAFPSSTNDLETSAKKRKIKHGLDGRPTNLNGGVPSSLRGDPLAGLMGKSKGKKNKVAGGAGAGAGQGQSQQGGMAKGSHSGSTPQPSGDNVPAIPSDTLQPTLDSTSTPTPDPTPTSPSTPMTSLQNSLSNKLESAKFRWLNEQLYTQPSGKGLELMRGEGGRAFEDVSLRRLISFRVLNGRRLANPYDARLRSTTRLIDNKPPHGLPPHFPSS